MNKSKAQPSFVDIASKVGHISSKTVNTNVFTALRYAPEDAVCLPYVSVRSMLAIPGIYPTLMDYQGNAALSRYAKSLLGISDTPVGDSNAKPVKKTQVSVPECSLEDRECLNSQALIGEQDSVNARLRQVLLHRKGNEYVSVTPLESSGLSALLRQKIQPLMDPDNGKIKQSHRPRLASMPIGGSKPQNVGVRVRDMACLFVSTPTANFALQSAVRTAFKGFRVLPAVTLLHQWCNSGQLANLCAGLDTRADKDRFSGSVRPLAQSILERATEASMQVQALLERHCESRRKEGWAEDELEDDKEEAWAEIEARLGFVQLGFLRPELRSPHWAMRAAWAIANAIDDWLIQQVKKRARSEPRETLLLTASGKTVLVNTLAKELT